MCRPEGQRCVVAAAGGVTFSRLRNGVQLHRFDSALPGGSSATAGGGNDAYTVLDCIYQPETNTYYVMDLMAWKVCVVLMTATSHQAYTQPLMKSVSCQACKEDC